MRITQRLADPWGIAAGFITGGMVAAVAAASAAGAGAAIVAGIGVGAVVYGVKVALGAMAARQPADPESLLPMPAKGSPAEVWLRRAERAVRTLHEQTETPRDEATRGYVANIDDQAAETLRDLRRLAAQVAAVESAAARIDINQLRSDAEPLRQAVGAAGDQALRGERDGALRSVEEQIAVFERLQATRDTLVARAQATAIGLEGLIARLAEVVALAATTGGIDTAAERIRDLADELDGMQAGLRETEAVSRRVLGGGGELSADG